MRNLFLKIFLGFWLTVLLAGLLMWLLATLTRPDEQPVLEKHLRFVARGLDGYADDALGVLRERGLAGWRAYQQSLPPDEPRPFILTTQLRPLADGPVPPMVVDLARRVLAEGRVEVLKRRRGFAIGRTLQLPNGQPAALVLHFRLPGREQGAPPPRWRSRWFDDGHPVGLFIFLLVSAGVCLLLTRSLTRPIGQLRRATRAFAAGRLETRVGADLRGDRELVRLGQDFDRMAERIEALVTGQQRLLRDISHELRSPLARLGVALGLARQKAPEELIASLDRIERESERLNALIEELLTLARLEQQA
ncbi:MAG: HAMP domain-containing protein, partial [Gammaproteobacteria bacterium]